MKKDLKYIIKRVIIGVLIAIVLGFLHSHNVLAESKKSLYLCGSNFNDICYNDRNSNSHIFVPLPSLDNFFAINTGSNYYGSTASFYNYDKEYFHIISTPYFNDSYYNYNYFLFAPFEYDSDIYTYSQFGNNKTDLFSSSPADIFITENPATADYILHHTFSQKQGDNEKLDFYKKTITINKKDIYIIWSQYSIYRNAYINDLSNPLNNSLYYTFNTTDKEVNIQFLGNNGIYEDFTKENFVLDLTDYFKDIISNGGEDFDSDKSSSSFITQILDILKMPFDFLSNLNRDSCKPISIPFPPLNTNFTLECLSSRFKSVLGDDIYNIFFLVISGIIAYRVTLVNITTLSDVLDPDDDKLEVLEL